MFLCKIVNLVFDHLHNHVTVGMGFAGLVIESEVQDVLPLLDGVGVDNLGGSVEGKNTSCVLWFHAFEKKGHVGLLCSTCQIIVR